MSLVTVHITLLAILSVATAAPNAKVFLIAGQSNSVGFNADGITDDDWTSERILQFSCCKDGETLPMDQCQLILAQDPLHHTCNSLFLDYKTIGFGMSFARELLNATTDDIVLVPSGSPGTGFYDDYWTAYTGVGFTRTVEKLKQAMELAESKYDKVTFEGILWHQGEDDAGDNFDGLAVNTTFYLNEDIIPLINAFRDVNLLPFSSKKLPFVCANLLPTWGTNPSHLERSGVWNAIAVLDQYVPYTASIPSYGLLGDPVYISDGELIHFTGRSLRIFGKRYYAGWQLAKYNKPENETTTDTKV